LPCKGQSDAEINRVKPIDRAFESTMTVTSIAAVAMLHHVPSTSSITAPLSVGFSPFTNGAFGL
ncbi:MAG TPA: hypothetical protein VL996_05465, partial [Methylocella sp.]|nr:hypothetical protein [Methylocella sp.]